MNPLLEQWMTRHLLTITPSSAQRPIGVRTEIARCHPQANRWVIVRRQTWAPEDLPRVADVVHVGADSLVAAALPGGAPHSQRGPLIVTRLYGMLTSPAGRSTNVTGGRHARHVVA